MPRRKRDTKTLDPVDDRRLVAAAQVDPARFGPLYELYFGQVYAFIARRVRARDVAEDLTSSVFQKALAALPAFEWRGIPFAAWLIRIAANALADHCARAGRETQASHFESADPSGTELESLADRARLFHLVEQLSKDQRRVILLRFVEEKSLRDIAGDLGRSEGAVKQLQFRALQNLRAKMGGADA